MTMMSILLGHGGKGRVAISLTATGNNYDVYANRGPSYVAGTSDITVTIAAPTVIGSTSTGSYAFLVPSSFNPTDTVTVVNNGLIQGTGGNGGAGGVTGGSGSSGAGGGNAIYVNRPTVITNNGTVASGGGGGGGGNGRSGVGFVVGKASYNGNLGGGGGGGGAGTSGGSGGAGGPSNSIPGDGGVPPAGTPGGAGTSAGGGGGGSGGSLPNGSGYPGGSGGGRGASGSSAPVGAGGGGAGNYIVGNPFVTWPATGTRQGGVA